MKKFIFLKKAYIKIFLLQGLLALGKTASVMYPLLNQLLQSTFPKFGMLILDVKGNFYKQVLEYSKTYNRISDVIVIELNSNTRYNPLDKPQLNASVLANRLKTILELFSTNIIIRHSFSKSFFFSFIFFFQS